MIDAERPEALWLALRMVQAVLRESPSAMACSSSVRNPADLTASASSLILEDCRAFILAVSGSGRWLRACTRATEDGRNKSDECDSMLISLWLAAGSPALECSSGAGCREHDRLSERVIVDVPRRHDANRPPGWAARNKDSTRPTRKAPPRRSRAFVFAIFYAGFGGPSQVRAVASTVVASPPFSFPLSMRGPRRSCHLRARNLFFQQY